MKDKIRKIKENISNAPHKKKTIIAILIAICMVGGAAGGYVYMTHTDFGKADVASQSDDKELTAEEKEKAKESGDKEAVKEAEKEAEKAKEKVNASNSNSSSSNSSSHKSNSGTSNKGSYSKPSNSGSSSNTKPSKPSSGNSGSSGSSSGGSSTSKPSKPAHQHNWQPIYDYDYANAYHRCKTCGANIDAMSDDESFEHTMKHGSYELYYPTIIVGHQCYSCGATK